MSDDAPGAAGAARSFRVQIDERALAPAGGIDGATPASAPEQQSA